MIHVIDLHLNRKIFVGRNRIEIRRIDEFGTRHLGLSRDDSHDDTVARTGLDLVTICERTGKTENLNKRSSVSFLRSFKCTQNKPMNRLTGQSEIDRS